MCDGKSYFSGFGLFERRSMLHGLCACVCVFMRIFFISQIGESVVDLYIVVATATANVATAAALVSGLSSECAIKKNYFNIAYRILHDSLNGRTINNKIVC